MTELAPDFPFIASSVNNGVKTRMISARDASHILIKVCNDSSFVGSVDPHNWYSDRINQ